MTSSGVLMRRTIVGLVLLGGGLVSQHACAAGDPPAASAVVLLQRQAAASGGLIYLRDIATIRSADADLKAQLQAIDIVELGDEIETSVITDRQVVVRLLLAGYSSNVVHVAGAEHVRVTPERITPAAAATVTDAGIEAAANRVLAEHLQLPADQVRARLRNPVARGLPGLPALHYDMTPDSKVQPGRVTMMIRLFADQDLLATRQVVFDVSVRQRLLTAARTIPAGRIIDESMLVEQQRFMTTPVVPLAIADVVGTSARTSMAAGHEIRSSDLIRGKPASAAALIEPRDLVRLTVRSGALRVIVPAAEALEKGRKGQMIRVRNVTSNKIITGRVVAAGEVEVPLY